MGHYSYSQPSITEPSLDYCSEGEFGRFPEFEGEPEVNSVPEKAGPWIPRTCFCGLPPITLTSTTEKNPGRVFYGCKRSVYGGKHLFKWLDKAMMEEIEELRSASTTNLAFIERMQDWSRFNEFPDIVLLASETEEEKELLLENWCAMTMSLKMKKWINFLAAGVIIAYVLFVVCNKMV